MCQTTVKVQWSKVYKKPKKCQPPAGNMPDLIQTVHVPSRGLARQKYKNKLNEKYKTKKKLHSKKIQSPIVKVVKVDKVPKKPKKCQPPAGNMPDLIQTEHVPSRGLARQKNKNKLNEKYKIQKKLHSKKLKVQAPVVKVVKIVKVVKVPKKSKKCQPPAGNMPDLIQTVHVPSRGLARHKNKNKLNAKQKNQNKLHSTNVTLADTDKLTKLCCQLLVLVKLVHDHVSWSLTHKQVTSSTG